MEANINIIVFSETGAVYCRQEKTVDYNTIVNDKNKLEDKQVLIWVGKCEKDRPIVMREGC